jgi:hypothetical protein
MLVRLRPVRSGEADELPVVGSAAWSGELSLTLLDPESPFTTVRQISLGLQAQLAAFLSKH